MQFKKANIDENTIQDIKKNLPIMQVEKHHCKKMKKTQQKERKKKKIKEIQFLLKYI
ncbi:hypothetical protein ACNANW_08975 (plasmid) [Campylobacter jejuni]